MKPRCPHCQTIHPSNAAIALNRFQPDGPTAYLANYEGGKTWGLRIAAEADYCRHTQEKP